MGITPIFVLLVDFPVYLDSEFYPSSQSNRFLIIFTTPLYVQNFSDPDVGNPELL